MSKEYEYVVADPDRADTIMIMRVSVTGPKKEEELFYLKQLFASADLSAIESQAELKNVTVRFVWTPQKFDALKMSMDEVTSIITKLPKNSDRVHTAIKV